MSIYSKTIGRFKKKSAPIMPPHYTSFFSGYSSDFNLLSYDMAIEQVRAGYMSVLWYYAGVNKIANSASNVKLLLYKRKDNGEEERVEKHPLLDAFSEPNALQSWQWIRFAMNAFRLITGNAYLHFQRGSRGDIIPGTIRLRFPQFVTPEATGNTVNVLMPGLNPVRYYYSGPDMGAKQYYEFNEIAHWMMFHPENEIKGLSPLHVARLEAESIKASGRSNLKLIQNDARTPGIFSAREVLDEDQVKRMKINFKKLEKDEPIVAHGGMTFTPFALSPKDLEYLEGLQHNIDAIATLLNIPVQLLGNTDSSTYANYEQATRGFFNDNIIPTVEQEASIYTRAFFPDGGYILKPDIDSIPSVRKERIDTLKTLQAVHDLTPNERRIMAGLPKLDDPLMDIIYFTAGMKPLDELGLSEEPGPPEEM